MEGVRERGGEGGGWRRGVREGGVRWWREERR